MSRRVLLIVFTVLLGGSLAVSQAAFSRCATLEQMADRMKGLTEGSPISVKSLRGKEYKGVVKGFYEEPDGRRLVTILKKDGTTSNIYIDQVDY